MTVSTLLRPLRPVLRASLRAGAVAAAAVLCMGAAHAAYPDKPVRIVVPFSPGSGGDIGARFIAQKLSEIWNQATVVDNQVGANGIIGTQVAARSPADGYTLLVPNDTVLTVNPALYRNLPYNPVKDFAPIALVGETPMMLVASPKFPVHTVKELLAAARARPGDINFGSGGNGSSQHLPMEMLMADTKVKMTHVPFKAMSAALTSVVADQVPVMFAGVSAAMPFLQSGKLTPIAVGSAQRLPMVPNVPTVAESGVPGFRYGTWLGFVAPAGTPKAIVDKVNADINTILRSQEVKDKLMAMGFLPATPGTPEQFHKLIVDDLALYGKLIKDAGIEPAN